jgi:hypothetical protein
MLDRRSLIGVGLAYAGLTIVVVVASAVHGCLGERAPAPALLERAPSAGLVEFLGPVAPGGRLGRWTVGEVGPLRSGNLRVELRAGAERVALTLARQGAGPVPLATTPALAVFPAVHDLDTHVAPPATREAATLLARALAEREGQVAAPAELLPLHR